MKPATEATAPITRYSVRSLTGGRRVDDLAAALIASRRLAGKDMSMEDADKLVKNLGLSRIIKTADLVERANALADKNREKLRTMVERGDPALVETLAREGYADSLAKQLDNLITGTAATANPDVGAKVQKLIQDQKTRDLNAGRTDSPCPKEPAFGELFAALKLIAYLLAIGVGLFVAYWILVSPYYLLVWMWEEDYRYWQDLTTWNVAFVVITILFWSAIVLGIVFRRRLGRFALASIRAVRRTIRRIEEASRPESDANPLPAHVTGNTKSNESPIVSKPSMREPDEKKCLAADIDDLGCYDSGSCGMKCNGEWAELEPGWIEGYDFDCSYDGRWTQCPHYCGPRI